MTDPTPTPPQLDRISHNHGPNVGPGLACRELTARAEAAEAKIAAVRASVLPYYEADGHACDDLDEYCARCVADEAMDALDGQECPECVHPHSVTRCAGAMCDCCEAIDALDGTA